MQRRTVMKLGAGAAAGALISSPAIAQSAPQIRWRMTSSFTKTLDLTYGAGELFCRYVSELTEGKFHIQQFAAGELVPGLQALDAVQSGAVEMAYTGMLFYVGKDPAFALGAAVPFMLNPRQQHGWYYHAGGLDLFNAFLAKHNAIGFPCGNTGMQWGGWFRNAINSTDDLKGLKMRIAGLAGAIAARVGVVPQQIAPGDIYPALERGAIDAVEYIGPYDDEKLGLNKVAKYYYTPGWQEGGTVFHVLANSAKWAELPPLYKKAVEVAAQATTTSMLGNYDTRNSDALLRLVASGVHVSVFTPQVVQAMYGAAQEHYAGLIASNEAFATIYKAQKEYRDRNYLYHQYADFQYDSMMLQLLRKA